tara:strand:+ start:50 stop:283 length:234 start_codon:yes stop_codon:yes gene_type:complete
VVYLTFIKDKSRSDSLKIPHKLADTKDSYSNTIKIIKTSITKCKSGEAKFMSSNEDCSVTGAKVINVVLILFQEYPI